MKASDSLRQYGDLLRIRKAAARRDAILLGALFAIGAFACLYLLSGLSAAPTGLSLFIPALVTISLGIGFVEARSRLDRIDGALELIDVLLRDRGG